MRNKKINAVMKCLKWSKAEIRAEKRGEARQILEWKKDARPGYWDVIGIRHCAIVRAGSAFEAVQKALSKGGIGDWEYPRPRFIGKRFPKIYRH